MNYQHLYQKVLEAQGDRLHFAAHSHHPWPDATEKAQLDFWQDSIKGLDNKWDKIYDEVMPAVQKGYTDLLKTRRNYECVAIAPNTHEFVTRIYSLFPDVTKLKVLTSDSEFHSFHRQTLRYQEEGMEVTRVEIKLDGHHEEEILNLLEQNEYDIVFFSHVFFNSGLELKRIREMILKKKEALFIIDGYHALGAIEVDTSNWGDDFFYLGGGYKYLQAGENCCFCLVPENNHLRPRLTGWFAHFGGLEANQKSIEYEKNGFGFMGATFDCSGMYRFNAVRETFKEHNLDMSTIRKYVNSLKEYFINELAKHSFNSNLKGLNADNILIKDVEQCGSFITIKTKNAVEIAKILNDQLITVDARADRLRFGFGIYQTNEMIDNLFFRLDKIDKD